MIPVVLTQSQQTHLLKPRRDWPTVEGRRVRTICGRGGTVTAELAFRLQPVCRDCRDIERILK